MSMEVVVTPPELSDGLCYLMGYNPNFVGYACKNGTFAPHSLGDGVVAFRTVQEAVRWAEATPRNWDVLNKNVDFPDLTQNLVARRNEMLKRLR